VFAFGVAPVTAQYDPAEKLSESGGSPTNRLPDPTVAIVNASETAVAAKAAGDATLPATPAEPHEMLPTGYRRVVKTTRVPLTEQLRESMQRAGKSLEIDPATGERFVRTIVDYLPEHWGSGHSGDTPVDSLGRPIVNVVPGLPGWAQADVDALRAVIVYWIAVQGQVVEEGKDRTETDGVLGNFIGQAIVRGIAFDDLVRLDDPAIVSDLTARSIIGYLHFYENLRFVHAGDEHCIYQPSDYSDEVVSFVTAHGYAMETVLEIEPSEQGGPEGGPSGCYARTVFARGMTLLTGQTDIWVQNGFDDAQADVPTGFDNFFFYECDDIDNNNQVRVSTNGYISFFQQGGGALDGTDFTNDAIPSTIDPDGYVAPWWDDLLIEVAQGTPDRVSYKTEGPTDQRVFTVEWFSISRRLGSTTDFHYFQVKLYETSGLVELHFDTLWATDTLDDSTTGMESYNGASGDCGLNCLNTNNAEPINNYRFAPPRPSNDDCADAEPLHYSQALSSISLRNATADGATSCGSSNGNRDVWYTFAAGCAGTLNLNTCGSRNIGGAGLGADTVLSVHSGCPGTAGNTLACNDDAGLGGCSGTDSAVSLAMADNQQVWIRVTHFGDLAFRLGNGFFNLNVDFVAAPAPANDDCGNAIVAAPGSTHVANLSCANADGESGCGSSTGNPDIWYTFTAPTPGGRLHLDLCGSRNFGGVDAGPDTVVAVYSGCPGNLGNEIDCNDDGLMPGCNLLDSDLLVPLTAGQIVRIRVSHFGFGTFRLGNGATFLHVNFCTTDPNCDGSLNGLDVRAFTLAMLNPGEYAAAFPGCDRLCHNDLNGDGIVGIADVGPFVAAVLAVP